MNPFRGLSLPQQSRKLPVYLSEAECRLVLTAAGEQKSAFLSVRDQTLLTFMVFTGARRSEVLELTWREVDLTQGLVRFVAAKGDKTRVVPLAEDAIEALKRWREVRPLCNHGHVFTIQSGASLGRRGIASALRRAITAAGLDRPDTTPHKLRHTFACLMLKNGAPLNCLQRLLGHSRLDTTGIYLEATAEDLKDAIGLHPLMKSKIELV